MENEQLIMQLISNGGDARTNSLKAIKSARKKEFKASDELMKAAKISLNEAHKFQTQLIRSEINGNLVKISLLMIHAQDHLMNAITVYDLAEEMIGWIKQSEGLER